MTDFTKTKVPSRRAYILAVLPFIVGCIVCSFLTVKMVRFLMASTDSYPRILVPGAETISLPEPGEYTIFFEHKSVMKNKAYVAPKDAIAGLTCSIKDTKTGQEIEVRPSTANMTYSFAGREGTSLFEFSIPAAGQYRIEADFPGGDEALQKYVLAIGHGFMKEVFQTIGLVFGIIGIFIVSIGVTVAAVVIIYLRRQRGRQGS